jgi:hypothetical protein
MSMDFIKELTSGGLVRPTNYEAYITFPGGGNGTGYYPLAESITLPGRGLATLQRKIWGPQIDMPYERIFPGEIELTFMLTADSIHEHRTAFSQWMDLIISPEDGSIEPNRGSYTGRIDIYLVKEDNTGDNLALSFFEVFPKGINPLSLSYAANNEYVRQTISFSFRHFTERSDKGNSGTQGFYQSNL